MAVLCCVVGHSDRRDRLGCGCSRPAACGAELKLNFCQLMFTGCMSEVMSLIADKVRDGQEGRSRIETLPVFTGSANYRLFSFMRVMLLVL